MNLTYYEQQKAQVRETFLGEIEEGSIPLDILSKNMGDMYENTFVPDNYQDLFLEVGLLTYLSWIEEEKLARKQKGEK